MKLDDTEKAAALKHLRDIYLMARALYAPTFGSFHESVERRCLRIADLIEADADRQDIRDTAINIRCWQIVAKPHMVAWLDQQLATLCEMLATPAERAEMNDLVARLIRSLDAATA